MKTKLFILAMLAMLPAVACAGWYSNSWKYRNCLTVISTGAYSNAQVLVSKSAGDFENLVSDSKLNADWKDLRFTSSDGTTPINHWKLPDGSGVYVKVPSVASGRNIIYMYYGNPSASDGSTFTGAMGAQADATTTGLWNFDERSSQYYVNDYSVNYNTATIKDWVHVLYTSTTWLAGECNKIGDTNVTLTTGSAFYSSGQGEYIYIASNTAMNSSKNLTVSFWIKPETTSGNRSLIRKDNYDNSWKFMLSYTETSSLEFFAKGNRTTEGRIAISKITGGKWHHVVGTYDYAAQTIKMYLNGALENTVTSVSDIGADYATYIKVFTQNDTYDERGAQ